MCDEVPGRNIRNNSSELQTNPPSVAPMSTPSATDNERGSVSEFFIKVVFVVCSAIGMGIFAFVVSFGIN
jgi:hypothetical protein